MIILLGETLLGEILIGRLYTLGEIIVTFQKHSSLSSDKDSPIKVTYLGVGNNHDVVRNVTLTDLKIVFIIKVVNTFSK